MKIALNLFKLFLSEQLYSNKLFKIHLMYLNLFPLFELINLTFSFNNQFFALIVYPSVQLLQQVNLKKYRYCSQKCKQMSL